MDTPENLTFTDFEIPVSALLERGLDGPMDTDWVRVQFPIPDGWEAPRKVQAWINANCPGEYQSYNYQNPRNKDHQYIMVVRFRDRNDALMFKLKGGHQAWEA